VFAALGDGTRLWLIARLTENSPASITRLASGGRITRQAITKHLHVLEGAGLAHARRQGREQLWELDARPLAGAQASLELISRQWERALGRLKAFVEGPG
jgi:DNA-binding transcriptional ArsR family regulator